MLEESVSSDRHTDQRWYVVWTHSHSEQLVFDQLTAKGFQLFLPKMEVWSRRAGVRRLIQVPMFPGYLFLHNAMSKQSYHEVRKTRGLVTVLDDGPDRLEVVPDQEIDAIHRVLQTRLPILAHSYLREGQRVRITGGPLADVEGILVRTKPSKGLLVLSVDLLHRAVAVEVDCTMATAA